MPKQITHKDVVSGIMDSSDPSYYVGRGNMLIDLDSNKLERIWEQVVDQVRIAADDGRVGIAAGENFVKMVKALTEKGDVSATTFLSALSDLAFNNWQHQGSVPSTESAAVNAIEGSDHANWGDHDGVMKDSLRTIVEINQPRTDIVPHKIDGSTWKLKPVIIPSPSVVPTERISGEFLKKHPIPVRQRPSAFEAAPGDIPYNKPDKNKLREILTRVLGKDPGPDFDGGSNSGRPKG